MWVILYLLGVIALLFALQSLALLAFKQPQQWTFGANSTQPKALKLVLKIILQSMLIGSIFVFPYLVGSNPTAYFGRLLPADKAYLFGYGQVLALGLSVIIYAIEVRLGWLYWKPRWPWTKALAKSAFSAVSSLTVVAVEEPLFRGIVLQTMLTAAAPLVAIPVSAVLFSGAHFIRKVSTYWPAVGLAVLGLWLGVAYYKTGNLWLSMGLHSGGILSIGIHRCFLNYRASPLLVGTQTFPVAGLIAIGIMLTGSALTWFVF